MSESGPALTPALEPGRELGVVKWFAASKGYGFIAREWKSDLFVHFSEIRMDGYKELKAEQIVEFSIGEDSKGQHATGVVIIQ